MRHGSSLTSGPKKITPGHAISTFFCHHLSWDLPAKSPIFWPEALLCSSAMVSWFPPGCSPRKSLCFFHSPSSIILTPGNCEGWTFYFLGKPSKKWTFTTPMKTAGSSKGSRLGMKKVQLAIEISNRKSFHDKSNDESFMKWKKSPSTGPALAQGSPPS